MNFNQNRCECSINLSSFGVLIWKICLLKILESMFVFFVFQNDDDGSDFDLPPSWVSPIEISLKGNKVACLLGRTMVKRQYF